MKFRASGLKLLVAFTGVMWSLASPIGLIPASAQVLEAPTDLLRGSRPTRQAASVFPEPLNLEQERRALNAPVGVASGPATINADTPTPPPGPPLSARDSRNLRLVPASPVGELRSDGTITPLANTRVLPLQGTASGADPDPYAPLGIRTGTFLLFPVLTQTFGTTNNADGSFPGTSDSFSTTDLRATLVSDWSVHQLRAEIGGSYQTFFNGTIDDLPRFDANFDVRYDASRSLTWTFGGSVNVEQQNTGTTFVSSQTSSGVSQDIQETTLITFIQAEKQAGPLQLRLRGTLTNRQTQADSATTPESVNQDASDTLAEARFRLAYDTSAVAIPFVEAGLGVRTVSNNAASSSNSTLYSLRGGLQFDRGTKLNGEVAVGYATETFDASGQGDLAAFVLDGTINWSPQRLTTITATAQTGFDVATNSADENSIIHVAGLSITRDIRPNLSLNARVLASLRSFQSSGREDVTVQTQLGAEWRLNRNAAIFATLGHESVDSSEANSSSQATTARLGFRLQK